MPKRILKGIIVSNKMQNTVVVRVETVKEHPKYKKKYKTHKKYKAHYDEGVYKIDDKVVIQETNPISKDKTWVIVK
ncbi:30S ribosomal protein S17 [Patescibacteria group bacterium]|nr:30S ribosomal protein S17 [Patescibacteria group bacterium]